MVKETANSETQLSDREGGGKDCGAPRAENEKHQKSHTQTPCHANLTARPKLRRPRHSGNKSTSVNIVLWRCKKRGMFAFVFAFVHLATKDPRCRRSRLFWFQEQTFSSVSRIGHGRTGHRRTICIDFREKNKTNNGRGNLKKKFPWYSTQRLHKTQ